MAMQGISALGGKLSTFAIISLCVLICYAVWTVKVIKLLKQSITKYRNTRKEISVIFVYKIEFYTTMKLTSLRILSC